MLDPINIVTSILLRIRPPAPPASEQGGATKPPPTSPAYVAPPPSLLMGGPEQHYRLRPSEVGWKTPVLMLPKSGILKIGLPLPGESLTIFHPVSSKSGTELISLPAPASSQGELWLVRLPEHQYLLLWMPLSVPPFPLNQLQLSLRERKSGSAGSIQNNHAVLSRYFFKACILLFIVFVMLLLS